MRGPEGVRVRELLGDAEVRLVSGLGARLFIMRHGPSPGVVGPDGGRWLLRAWCLSGSSSRELMVVHPSSSATRHPPTPSKSRSGPILGRRPRAVSLAAGVREVPDMALELRRRRRRRRGVLEAVELDEEEKWVVMALRPSSRGG